MLKISDKHKTIFWHTHKTGGTYIKYILERFYDFHMNWEERKNETNEITVLDKIFIENDEDFEKELKNLELFLEQERKYIDIDIKKLLETNNPTIDWDKKEVKIVYDKTILTDLINPEEMEIEIENEKIKLILSDKIIWNKNEDEKFGLLGKHIDKHISKQNNLINSPNIPIEKWQTYFKFCVVRNPYDRAISSFEFLKQKDNYTDNRINPFLDKEECDFKYFFKNEDKLNDSNFMNYHAYASQVCIITDKKNNIKIDYIAKFENLEEEIIEILKKIGINEFPHLKLIKENIKINISKKKNLDKYFDQATLEIINEKFKEDFETFGYKMYTNVEELNNHLLELNDENLINKKKIDLLNKYKYENNSTENQIFIENFLLEQEKDKIKMKNS